jgi:hypothetical protein
MNRIMSLREKEWPSWVPDVLALCGLLVYLIESILYAYTTVSNLDEGAYLLKGFLFASGKYQPFEPGIWTNKAPLAFLIPGYVQLLFGPGLRTGRYLAVLFGLMAVIGTWAVTRRLAGRWFGAAAVWILALSPMVIKIYSGGATQSTIACMLAWSLFLALGEKRAAWQLALSGLLAGLMLMVRQNMVPVLPLLIIYAFWQHGWKAKWLLLSGVSSVVILFLMYWPDILALWSWVPFIRLPAGLTYTGGGTVTWHPNTDPTSRLLSILQAFRFHFTVLFGVTASLLLLPGSGKRKSAVEFRIWLFLFVLFWALILMHLMAAVGGDYCVFCLTPYIAFFNIAGILLLILSIRNWNWQPARLTQVGLVIFTLVVFAGIGYSAFEDIGSTLLQLPAPRVRDLRILPGFVTWWDILSNGFDLRLSIAKKYASLAFGLIIGSLFLAMTYFHWRRTWAGSFGLRFGAWYVSVALVLGTLLSPLLSGSAGKLDCRSDVILANEQIGAYLRSVIPDDSLVYWDGGLSAAPLLYLPDVEILPAQINNGYAFIRGGDTAQLYRLGLWNEEIADHWRVTADFFIIQADRYPAWKEFLIAELFDEFRPTPVGTSCLEETQLRVFRRK